jgi:hypothetical protein
MGNMMMMMMMSWPHRQMAADPAIAGTTAMNSTSSNVVPYSIKGAYTVVSLEQYIGKDAAQHAAHTVKSPNSNLVTLANTCLPLQEKLRLRSGGTARYLRRTTTWLPASLLR